MSVRKMNYWKTKTYTHRLEPHMVFTVPRGSIFHHMWFTDTKAHAVFQVPAAMLDFPDAIADHVFMVLTEAQNYDGSPDEDLEYVGTIATSSESRGYDKHVYKQSRKGVLV